MQVAKNKYGVYEIPDSLAYRPCCRKLLNGLVWEVETVEFIGSVVGGKSIVTAGAFIGDMLPAFSSFTRQNVYSFEPVPQNYKYASKTIALNELNNVVLRNVGLSDKNGTMNMLVKRGGLKLGGASHVVRSIRRDQAGVIPVKCMRLDKVLDSDVDISVIHLDAEGHEYWILRGAENTIQRNRPIIILEKPGKRCRLYLEGLGYTLGQRLNANRVFHPHR